MFVFLEACLSKIETKLFAKAAWVLTVDILLQIYNLNWSLLNCLRLRYINLFGSNFSNFVLKIVYMMMINQTSLNGIGIHKKKFRTCTNLHHVIIPS